MTPKIFAGFTAITAIVVVAAGVSIAKRYQTASYVPEKDAIFPAMYSKINEVTEISVEDKQGKVVVARKGDQWVMPERHDYPVSNEIVRDTLVGIAELKILEPKTKRPALYTRIQVDDLSVEKSLAKHLLVKGKDGEKLADALIGRRNFDTTGLTDEGRYVRRTGEEQSWLVAGRFDMPDAIKKWVGKEFLDVDDKRVDRAVTKQPDGTELIVQRAKQGETHFDVVNTPKGREVEYQIDVDNVSDGVDKIELEDVKQAGEVDFPKDKTIHTTYHTYDGLQVDVDLQGDDKTSIFWAKFKASVAPDAKDEDKAARQAEADKINAAVSPWIYQIPAFKYRYMSRRLDEVLKKLDS